MYYTRVKKRVKNGTPLKMKSIFDEILLSEAFLNDCSRSFQDNPIIFPSVQIDPLANINTPRSRNSELVNELMLNRFGISN